MRLEYQTTVGGLPHPGQYKKEYSTRDQAERDLKSFRSGPLWVKYNPEQPKENLLEPCYFPK